MKKMVSIGLMTVLLIAGGCNQKGSKKVDLKTDDDKTLYSVGALFGQRLQTLELKEQELDALVMGLRDSASGGKLAVDPAKFQRNVQELFKKRMTKNSDSIKKQGVEFIAKFLKDGGKKTESGLTYKMLKEGTGAKPKATDTVEVHYHGTLIDGTVFDSSVDRGKKVKFPLNRVIKGWTEGLQLLGKGGKIKLVIPSELAYGDHGAPPKIPGGATLIFEVELFDIVKEDKKEVKKEAKKK